MSEREYPIITFLTVVRFSGEFALVELRMMGDEVISRDVIEYGPFVDVWAAFHAASVDRFGRKDIQ